MPMRSKRVCGFYGDAVTSVVAPRGQPPVALVDLYACPVTGILTRPPPDDARVVFSVTRTWGVELPADTLALGGGEVGGRLPGWGGGARVKGGDNDGTGCVVVRMRV
ncbi:hypothetical protein B1218_37185 [Pseudomonas ogarae]|nr:hypothetical protein B1218_37185 [Pseudomonas ogarae]